MIKTLSTKAQHIIDSYEQLHIGNHIIRCPYVNNKHIRMRAALRVLIGKGTAKEIEEEATLIAMRDKLSLELCSEEQIRIFLVDHHLGIDCSAFAFYILNAHTHGKLKKSVTLLTHNPLRKLLGRLRTVENVNVKVLADNRNSYIVSIKDVLPGDIITMIGTGKDHTLDHILVVNAVEYQNDIPHIIHYVHSLKWKKDGKYNHGIRKGTITISHSMASLLEQQWQEHQYTTTPENETLWRATTAQVVELRRVN